MANTTFGYVRSYEQSTPSSSSLLPNTYLLVRIDGHKFHAFSAAHDFEKPNDGRALALMDKAAERVMKEWGDVVMAFGESDEYSFLIRRQSTIHNRRADKITTLLVSLFTSAYVFHWPDFFPPTTSTASSSSSEEQSGSPAVKPNALRYPPSFDARVVMYPSEREVRDYFSWRQADTHINNLYNTTFWALVLQGGMTAREASAALDGTFSKDKHEILFSRFNINYNRLPARYRKGSILVRRRAEREGRGDGVVRGDVEVPKVVPRDVDGEVRGAAVAAGGDDQQAEAESTSVSDRILQLTVVEAKDEQPPIPPVPTDQKQKTRIPRQPKPPKPYDGTHGEIITLHEDLIGDEAPFWRERPWLLS